jgi:signal transduction histidine kinase
MMRANGSRFWANGAMFPLRDAAGEVAGFAKMLRDRTDLRQQLQAMRNEIAARVERERQKDHVLALASHELRNPLFAMTVAVDAIRRAAQNIPNLAEPFGVIDRQLHAIRRLLDDITDAARASTGQMKLRRDRLDLRDIIRGSLETMRPAIQSRGHVVHEILLPVAIPVDGDSDRLQQVVRNLVDNAVKYSPPGGRIGIEATTEGTEAVLKVEDNGMGVAPDMQSRIFELFTRVHHPDHQDEKGLGIGLALVKNLVAQHGGTIQVRSNGPGTGSEFTVRLPLATASE